MASTERCGIAAKFECITFLVNHQCCREDRLLEICLSFLNVVLFFPCSVVLCRDTQQCIYQWNYRMPVNFLMISLIYLLQALEVSFVNTVRCNNNANDRAQIGSSQPKKDLFMSLNLCSLRKSCFIIINCNACLNAAHDYCTAVKLLVKMRSYAETQIKYSQQFNFLLCTFSLRLN